MTSQHPPGALAAGPPSAQAGPPTTARPGLLVAALSFVCITSAAVQSVALPLLPDIARQLDVSTAAASWVITVGLVAAAVFAPLFGRLADQRGGGTILLLSSGLLLAGSVLTALAPNFGLLLAGRVLQGVAGAMFPLAITVLRVELPPERRTAAMALCSSMLGVGGGVGPVVAGLLRQVSDDYRLVFWAVALAGAAALATVVVAVPRRPGTGAGRTDAAGTVLLTLGLVALMVPLSQGSAWGWTSLPVLGLFAAAGVLLTGFVAASRRRPDPLVDITLMAHRPVMITNLVALLVGGTMYVFFLGLYQVTLTPPEAGYGFGVSALYTAVVFVLPSTAVTVFAAQHCARLVERYGGRIALIVAAVLTMASFGSLALWHDEQYQVVLAGIAVSLSVSLAYAALPALLAVSVPLEQTGSANSVNALSRWVGGAAASSAVTAVLAAYTLGESLPLEGAVVTIFLIGAAAGIVLAVLAVFGLRPAAADPVTDRSAPRRQPAARGAEHGA